jgi:hypothetical protein
MFDIHQAVSKFMVSQTERAQKFQHNVLTQKTKDAAIALIRDIWLSSLLDFFRGFFSEEESNRLESESAKQAVISTADDLTDYTINVKSAANLPSFEWSLLTKLVQGVGINSKGPAASSILLDLMLKGFTDYCSAKQGMIIGDSIDLIFF